MPGELESRLVPEKHVCVVGGGIIGLCTAWALHESGCRVTVLEREPVFGTGCSFGNAGMIVPSHFTPLAAPGMMAMGLKWMLNPESPFAIRPRPSWSLVSWGWQFWRASTLQRVKQAAPVLRDLSLASRAIYQRWATEWENPFGLCQHGMLLLCKTEHGLEEEGHAAESARQLGLDAHILSPQELALREPGVEFAVAGAVEYPADCHLNPGRLLRTLAGKLDQAGVERRADWEALGWQMGANSIQAVKTKQGPVKADEFVLCAGSWSPLVTRDLKMRLPVQPGKGYSLTIEQAPQQLHRCAILTEARVAVTPLGQGLRVGGTLELTGLNSPLQARRVRGIVRSVPAYLPGFPESTFEGVAPWEGLRPCSPDGLPYIGRSRHYRNFLVATGHAMLGISLGPITGQLISELVAERQPSFPLELLQPDRYSR